MSHHYIYSSLSHEHPQLPASVAQWLLAVTAAAREPRHAKKGGYYDRPSGVHWARGDAVSGGRGRGGGAPTRYVNVFVALHTLLRPHFSSYTTVPISAEIDRITFASRTPK